MNLEGDDSVVMIVIVLIYTIGGLFLVRSSWIS